MDALIKSIRPSKSSDLKPSDARPETRPAELDPAEFLAAAVRAPLAAGFHRPIYGKERRKNKPAVCLGRADMETSSAAGVLWMGLRRRAATPPRLPGDTPALVAGRTEKTWTH